jgi:hypothetical protein
MSADRKGRITLDPMFVDASGKPGITQDRGVPHGVVFDSCCRGTER